MTKSDKPRIGLIARMDRTGLGYQTKALFDMLKPTKTLVINSSPFNGNDQFPEWYYLPNNEQNTNQNQFVAYTMGMNEGRAFDWLLFDLDVLITCEVPYYDRLYEVARERGIKVILQPNAELNPHFNDSALPKPDYFFLPSTWYENETRSLGVPTVVCPPPIAMKPKFDKVKKEEGKLKVLHIAGKRALADRNGTTIVEKLGDIDGVEITIRSQAEENFINQADLYKGGYHVVLMPRRYGGLCMPMLEALSQGMPVLMPNIKPNDGMLPENWLFNARFSSQLKTKRVIRSFTSDPNSIRSLLNRFKDMDQERYDLEVDTAHWLYKTHDGRAHTQWEEYINRIVEGEL